MHLSHLNEDLEAWYLNFDFDERVLTAFRPGLKDVSRGRRRFPRGRRTSRRKPDRDPFGQHGTIRPQRVDPADVAAAAGHRRPDGTVYPKGTAIPQRADFNTLDNPFAWTARPSGTRCSGPRPPACISPCSIRRATTLRATGSRWTACFPTERSSRSAARRAQGFNSMLTTTHRQNFLVPPRRHRSFPLAEL